LNRLAEDGPCRRAQVEAGHAAFRSDPSTWIVDTAAQARARANAEPHVATAQPPPATRLVATP
jgi:hypothetical protein